MIKFLVFRTNYKFSKFFWCKNMSCYYEHSEIKYYPKMDELMNILSIYEQIFEKHWYLVPDDEQVIISKFLYSVQLLKELSISLLGLNGIVLFPAGDAEFY